MRTRSGLILALLLAPIALPNPLGPGGDERMSLEAFLARMRARQTELYTANSSKLDAVFKELERLAEDRPEAAVEVQRRKLLAFGPTFAPLMVGAIDPGGVARPKHRFRARQVALVLHKLASPAITDQLLDIVRDGSAAGRNNALKVLQTSPEPARVVPVLQELYRSVTGDLRRSALETLAHLGGPDTADMITAALSDPDEEVVNVALYALGDAGNMDVADRVVALAESDEGPNHVRAILAYFSAIPDALGNDEMISLLKLAKHTNTGISDQELILSTLGDFEPDKTTQFKREIEPLTESGTKRVYEAALVLLAKMGDNSAKTKLLKPYTEYVKRNKNVVSAYMSRGEIYYRIADYKKAVKDYKEAIDLSRSNNISSRAESDMYLMVARCHALSGDFRDAEKYLDDAPGMSLAKLHALAKDPDFREMAEHRTYRRAFHLND